MNGRIAVIGLGLIGGSIARRLAGQRGAVVGFDSSPSTRAAAASAGIPCLPDLNALAAWSPDVVVLAVPLRAMRQAAVDIARLAPHAIVLDVGSVKGAVRDAMVAAGIGGRYVGGHPMAGTERSGFEASSDGLLVGAPWAVTLDEATDPDAVLRVLDLVTVPLGGVARILTDEVHDEAVALVSHIPHVLATELLSLAGSVQIREVALGLAAGSFRDGTRVARTDPRRTEAMVTGNASWVASALRVVIRDLELLVADLETNSPVAEFFDRPDPARSRLDAPPAPVGAPRTVRLDRAGWARDVLDECARGGVVVAVDRAHRTVSIAS